jgi:hypothetical protein
MERQIFCADAGNEAIGEISATIRARFRTKCARAVQRALGSDGKWGGTYFIRDNGSPATELEVECKPGLAKRNRTFPVIP